MTIILDPTGWMDDI